MNLVLAMSPTHREPHEDADGHEPPASAPVMDKFSRQRRRFVRPGMTIYEHSFSRLASGRRSRRVPGPSTPAGDRLQPLPTSQTPRDANTDGTDDDAELEQDTASPGVSSLSSVLDEVINGRSCAVTNFADAAAPATPTTTYVVRRDPDGTYYVASSDGQRYFADSAIGQVFLGSAPAAAEASAAASSLSPLSPTSLTRRSDMDFVGSRGWQRVHALKRQSGGSSAELMAHDAVLRPRLDERTDEEEGREDRDYGSASSPSRPKSRVSRLGSAVKRRVQSVKHRGVSRFSRRSGIEVDIDADDAEVDIDAAVLGNQEAMHRPSSHENELPMLDASVVDTRGRGDSSWEVPASGSGSHSTTGSSGSTAHFTAAHSSPATGAGACTNTNETRTSAEERERGSSDWELAPPGSSPSDDRTSSSSPAFPPRKVPIQPLPRLQLRDEKLAPAAPSTITGDDEEDEEEVNELMQSFRSVRDIDLVAPRASSFDEDAEQPRESSLVSDNSGSSSSSSDRNSTSVAPTTRSSTSSATYAGRSSGSLDFGAGRIRVSSSGASIAEFVGGYKSHVSRRAGVGLGGPNADGFVNRSRSIRHGRKSPAAQSTPATELGRKLRDARNRIPAEFRDELTPQPKKKRKEGAKSVRFDPTPQVREFEVEEEEGEGADGGEQREPDEIVDAVQLVAKEEVLHAEELFFQEEPDLMFAMSNSDLHDAISNGHDQEFDIDGDGDNPLAFSELRVDKPLDISDL